MATVPVVIEQVLGRSCQGVTQPFICVGDDGETYYVKGAGAGRRSLVSEWTAGHLATAFGLPVPPFVLAEVPPALVALKVRPDLADLGAGLVFASRKLAHAQELTSITRARVPVETARDVLVFDWWVRNQDRILTDYGGNPNLLWDMEADALAVIDHNQAFDWEFDPRRFMELHVFAEQWNSVFGDFDARGAYVQRLESLLTSLPTLRASIPEAWWWVADDVPAQVSWDAITDSLERCRRADFWNLP
ncbi:MAG: hypothetical protein O9345_07050 [Burkholderiaceae bacterium]|uniref:HipA family kinase n=1 Tax=Gemmatimonas sp. TaxID=1962908 RepID=UPI0022CA1E81|nr:hypothetical protein [Acidobacteriaceae bacterium]MCZ8103100.1 hypothetical protein [Burkholderiales bacterium]MCZ8337899.1 hypothetical protein [Burkholderiaceae bacterium]